MPTVNFPKHNTFYVVRDNVTEYMSETHAYHIGFDSASHDMAERREDYKYDGYKVYGRIAGTSTLICEAPGRQQCVIVCHEISEKEFRENADDDQVIELDMIIEGEKQFAKSA